MPTAPKIMPVQNLRIAASVLPHALAIPFPVVKSGHVSAMAGVAQPSASAARMVGVRVDAP